MSKPCLLEAPFNRVTGQPFRLVNLLGESKKTVKGLTKKYLTRVLYMLPAKTAAGLVDSPEGQAIVKAVSDKFKIRHEWLTERVREHNACPSADKCKYDCLAKTSGHLAMTDNQLFMFAKTCLYLSNPHWFADQLDKEITFLTAQVERKAKKESEVWRGAVRLNGGTDLHWEENATAHLFGQHPTIAFYDYTKIEERMQDYLCGLFPANYSLTFSAGSSNDRAVARVFNRGGNVAVVLHDRSDATEWCIDGDENDLRFRDKVGCWVLLSPKGWVAKRNRTYGFIRKNFREQEVRMAAQGHSAKRADWGTPEWADIVTEKEQWIRKTRRVSTMK